ncbi:hypothetical protein PghCCS26_26790 [Paenibacillus glycanilyticus]|uniref:Uncharacterized protein n=1 Tax=Paenibacillus glycanilyticus TaxID=126569 RepID=A0ABQ6NKE3_9BACL|nr:hypothetical protein [Paenibacillus glycanilyticus]GMK45551.1 hypothetical protein PghCCS26_26790 [Paenibacillus glycanilyticus]
MEKSKKEKGKLTEVKPAASKPATIAPAKAENQAPAVQASVTAPQTQSLKDHCFAHTHRYVLAQTHDGWCIDGIVEYVDDQYLCLAVPCSGSMGWDSRAFLPYPGLEQRAISGSGARLRSGRHPPIGRACHLFVIIIGIVWNEGRGIFGLYFLQNHRRLHSFDESV